MERLCRSPLGNNSNVVSVRRRCLVEVDKPGVLVVMEDMVDQVKIMFIRVPKKAKTPIMIKWGIPEKNLQNAV